MSDLESIYNDGYQIGVSGVKSPCPDDYEHERPHDRRDAWTEGYKAGWQQFRRNRDGYNRGNLQHMHNVHGKLWIESKDRFGYQSIYDCEGGTLLCKIKLDGETRVLIPKHNLTPEMALMLVKAIQKAAQIAYRVGKDREYRPSRSEDMMVERQSEFNEESDPRLRHWHYLGNLSGSLGKSIKKMYWLIRNKQPSDQAYVETMILFQKLADAMSIDKQVSP